MAMTQYNGDPEVISKLGTTPQERGLTTEQFKAKFDEALKAFVTWFNDTHKTEFDAHLAESVSQTISFTRDATLSGSQIVSGFTKKPKSLIIHASMTTGKKKFSIGFVGKNSQLVSGMVETTGFWSAQGGKAIKLIDSTGPAVEVIGTVTINNDNTITVNWEILNGGFAGTISCLAIAHYHGGA